MLSREVLRSYVRSWSRHNVFFGFVGNPATNYHFSALCMIVHTGNVFGLMRRRHLLPPAVRRSYALADGVLTYRYPHRYSDPARRGMLNPHFLDAGILHEQLLSAMQANVGCADMLLLPLPHIFRTEDVSPRKFFDRLAGFIDRLPGTFRYAVELANTEYLLPEYFECLRGRNVTHVLNTCPTMPSVLDQIQLPSVLTSDVVVVRTIAGTEPEQLLGTVETIRRCVDEKRSLYVFIEGEPWKQALRFMATTMELLNHDLAKLSPLKRRAA